MARSTYIYLVLDSWSQVCAAFTVKHEMETYLERGLGPENYQVMRVRDGGEWPPSYIKQETKNQ